MGTRTLQEIGLGIKRVQHRHHRAMVARGLIERLDGPGRSVRHAVTAKGRQLLLEGSAVADAVLTESFRGLSARQLDQLGALLDQLTSDSSPPTPAHEAIGL